MAHRPDFEELRALRALVREAIADAAASGNYSATLGRYRVRATRRDAALQRRGPIQVAFEITEQHGVVESGVVSMPEAAR